jgi:hypothetical protein
MVKKSKHAQWMAKRRAESLTPERRKEIARKAIKSRWDRVRKEKEKP